MMFCVEIQLKEIIQDIKWVGGADLVALFRFYCRDPFNSIEMIPGQVNY